MARLKRIVSFLDEELRVSDFTDDSNNGLQVENSGNIRRVCAGVDASLDFFKEAAGRKADLLVCHHGISWGDSLKRLSGLNYRRIKFLLEHDMALYACHLPLDAHPRLGNNALICKALGLRRLESFGSYHGSALGFRGELARTMDYGEFKGRLRSALGNISAEMDFGKNRVKTAAVVSGGGAGLIAEAAEGGADVFVSGEPKLSAYNLAREYGLNAVFAGHYATEIFGVRAVARLLAGRFRIKTEFVDMKTPF